MMKKRFSLTGSSSASLRLGLALLAAGLATAAVGQRAQHARQKPASLLPVINVGFSPDMFSGLEKEDVVSALKIWGDSVLEMRGVQLGSMPRIYNTQAELRAALHDGEIDFAALLTTDFLAFENEVALDRLHFSQCDRSTTEEYVLMIHRDSTIVNLSDLQQKTLLIQSGFRASLAPTWLETQLMAAGYTDLARHFRKMEFKDDALQTILPVFFGNADACLMTRRSVNQMVEMNPQLSKKLKILLTSGQLVPSLFCVRADYNAMLRNEFLSSLRVMELSPSGRQVLNMFQADKFVAASGDELADTRLLLERYRELKQERDEQ